MSCLFFVFSAIGLIIITSELWYYFFSPPIEWTRKIVHALSGLLVSSFHWIFLSDWPVIFFGIVVSFILLATRKYSLCSSIHAVHRRTFGDLYYIFSAVILFIVSHEPHTLYFISMMILTISDTLAALIGTHYQNQYNKITQYKKSREGSIAFFLSTFVIVTSSLCILTDTNHVLIGLIGLQLAFILTKVEAICCDGLDNLLIPFISYFLLGQIVDLEIMTVLFLLILSVFCLSLSWIKKPFNHLSNG